MLNESIALLARETGWTLEYIRKLPASHFFALVDEISYQRQLEQYQQSYNSALVVCTLASSHKKHYRPVEIIGEKPQRRAGMAKSNLGVVPKIDKITLADGKEYELSVLNVNIMADLEEMFDKPFGELVKPPIRMKVFRALLFVRLRPNYSDLTEEQVGKLVTDDVLVALMKKLGA